MVFYVEYLSNRGPKIVYHVTAQSNASKIIEFGFDRDLCGQGTILGFKKRGDVIINDKFVIEKEEMLEHSAINTHTDYRKCIGYGDCLLRVTLKDDIKLLDAQKIPKDVKRRGWRRIFTLAKENGCDGITNRYYVMIFTNKKIEKIELVQEGDLEFDDFADLSMAYKNRLDLYKMYKQNTVVINQK
jgi:hypothetical protein